MKSVEEGMREIEEIKKEICRLGEIRPGSLSEQYNVCGTPNCVCKDPDNPKKHGPYHQLSYTRRGRSRTEFVKAEDVEMMSERVAAYRRLKELCDRWIDVSVELSKVRKKLK